MQLEDRLKSAVLLEWRRNYGSDKKPDYRSLCTYVQKFVRGKLRSTFDLHYVNPRLSDGGTADVGFYVLKYMLKPSDREKRLQQALHLNLPEDEYEDVWSLVKSKCFYSKHFGLGGFGKRKAWRPSQQIVDYVKRSVRESKKTSVYPQFINPVDGKHFPLSRFYKGKGFLYSLDDAFEFWLNDPEGRPDNVVFQDEDDPNQVFSDSSDFASKVNVIDKKHDNYDFDDLF